MAFLTQAFLIASVLLVCWSRLVFEPLGIKVLLGMIGGIYLVSTAMCCLIKRPASIKSLRQGLLATGFIMVCLSGLAAGYVYKHQCLGIHIYFVPSMSMHPTLKPGEFILVDTWAFEHHTPSEGDVVVFKDNKDQILVKRIAEWPVGALPVNEKYFVLGDYPEASQDSRHFGGIEPNQIIGQVKLVLLAIDQEQQLILDRSLTLIR